MDVLLDCISSQSQCRRSSSSLTSSCYHKVVMIFGKSFIFTIRQSLEFESFVHVLKKLKHWQKAIFFECTSDHYKLKHH